MGEHAPPTVQVFMLVMQAERRTNEQAPVMKSQHCPGCEQRLGEHAPPKFQV